MFNDVACSNASFEAVVLWTVYIHLILRPLILAFEANVAKSYFPSLVAHWSQVYSPFSEVFEKQM